MTLGPTAFGAVLWGAVLAVLAVFVYEVYVLAADAGWLGPDAGGDGAPRDREGDGGARGRGDDPGARENDAGSR